MINHGRMRVRSSVCRSHGLLTLGGQRLQPFLKSLRLADFLHHRLMPGAQCGDVLFQERQLGPVGLVDLIIGGLNLLQLALERGKGAFITLVGEMCLLPLLLQPFDVRLGLSQFIGPCFHFLLGGVVSPL